MEKSEAQAMFNVTARNNCCLEGPERVIIPLAFSIFFVLGSIGNTLVIIVVIREIQRRISNATNVFMINLMAADLIFLLFCIPFHAVIYTVKSWPFGNFVCKFVHFFQYAGMMASVLTLVAMAVDRFLAVRFPIQRKFYQSTAIMVAICVGVWMVSCAIASPWPVFYTVKVYTTLHTTPIDICADNWGEFSHYRPIYFVILFVVGYALPLMSIFVLSALTLYNIWSVTTQFGTHQQEHLNNKRKATRSVIALVVIFAVCWLPYHVMWLWVNFSEKTFASDYRSYSFYYLNLVGFVMSYANSTLNPVVYAFISKHFRMAFFRTFNCCASKSARSGRSSRFSYQLEAITFIPPDNSSTMYRKKSASNGMKFT